mgnify:CR=1 FL=1
MRPDAGAPERLVRVDVPDPRDAALVHQHRLDRAAARACLRMQPLRIERFREGLGSDVAQQFVCKRIAALPQHQAKAARIAETHDVAVGES